MGTVVLAGATSGSTTLTPVDAVTATITLPSATGTLVTGTSGTYTPSITNTSNISSSTPTVTSYIRVGNSVTVGGYLTATSSGAGGCELTLSLPVSTTMTSISDLGGSAAAYINATTQYPIMVQGLAPAKADFYFNTTGINTHTITFQFMYIVK